MKPSWVLINRDNILEIIDGLDAEYRRTDSDTEAEASEMYRLALMKPGKVRVLY